MGTATADGEHAVRVEEVLSVSSVGSWALQLIAFLKCEMFFPAFSILGRIVGTATEAEGIPAEVIQELSVSSVGSWALQPRPSINTCGSPGNFQYPRSDRGHCNTAEEVQVAVVDPNFQYPRSDRGHCNTCSPPAMG